MSLAALSALSACGGGEDPRAEQAGASAFAARVHALQARSETPSAALSQAAIGAKELFDWAEYKYPSLFPKGPQNFSLVHEGVSYTVRAYPGGTYLGLTDDGRVYGLGAFTSGQLQAFGRLGDYSAQIQADSCALYPGSCNSNQPLGPVNECFLPASQALALGSRFQLSYSYDSTGRDGTASGEVTTESLVEQHTQFEGQPAVQRAMNTDITVTQAGQTITSSYRSKYYAQVAANELILALGDETVLESPASQGNTRVTMRRVHQPAFLNSETTLQPGQSLTRSLTSSVSTTTVLSGTPLPPSLDTQTRQETYAFEARETIQVRGRNFETCRYRETDPGSPGESQVVWLLLGKGIPVRTISTDADGTVTQELKSGTFNGRPL
ncbi:MAG: hypothetical protein U1E77_19190 [Inhella sp.]